MTFTTSSQPTSVVTLRGLALSGAEFRGVVMGDSAQVALDRSFGGGTSLHADCDREGRGFDSPTKPDVLGLFDRGADESPLLFASGFESGGFAGGSSTQP